MLPSGSLFVSQEQGEVEGWHFLISAYKFNFGGFFSVQGQVISFGPVGNRLQLGLNGT